MCTSLPMWAQYALAVGPLLVAILVLAIESH